MSPSWAEMTDRQRARCRTLGFVPLDYSAPVAADWPDLLEIVERLVKPERDPQTRVALRDRWWQFGEKRPGLRAALLGLDSVLAITQTSPHLAVSILKIGSVYDQKLVIVADGNSMFSGVCQSRIHEVWCRDFSGTMKDDLSYTPTDSFRPFPFPYVQAESQLSEAASTYYDYRAKLMIDQNEGLTATYNRFHEISDGGSDIIRLRNLHHELDRAVLRCYGWCDLADEAEPEFLTEDDEPDHRYQRRLFWPAPFRDKVLARVLALNAERASDEHARGVRPDDFNADEEEEELALS